MAYSSRPMHRSAPTAASDGQYRGAEGKVFCGDNAPERLQGCYVRLNATAPLTMQLLSKAWPHEEPANLWPEPNKGEASKTSSLQTGFVDNIKWAADSVSDDQSWQQ